MITWKCVNIRHKSSCAFHQAVNTSMHIRQGIPRKKKKKKNNVVQLLFKNCANAIFLRITISDLLDVNE